jgi:hypothetical protein
MKQVQTLQQRGPAPEDDDVPPEETRDDTGPGRRHGDTGFFGSPYGDGDKDDRAWGPPVRDEEVRGPQAKRVGPRRR